jgi:hypothetical protein
MQQLRAEEGLCRETLTPPGGSRNIPRDLAGSDCRVFTIIVSELAAILHESIAQSRKVHL